MSEITVDDNVVGSTPVDPFLSAVAESTKRLEEMAEERRDSPVRKTRVKKHVSYTYTFNNYSKEDYKRLKGLKGVLYHVGGEEVRKHVE